MFPLYILWKAALGVSELGTFEMVGTMRTAPTADVLCTSDTVFRIGAWPVARKSDVAERGMGRLLPTKSDMGPRGVRVGNAHESTAFGIESSCRLVPTRPRLTVVKRRFSKFACALVLLLLPRLVGVASAQQSDSLASDLKQRGDAALAEGRYQEALDAYTRAIAIEETPELHYNRARALQALARHAEALSELEAFERSADAALKLRVPGLDTMMAAARGKVATVSISANVADAVVELDDGRKVELPLADLRLDAGQRTFRAAADGYEPAAREVLLEGGTRRTIAFELVPIKSAAVLTVRSPVTGAEVWLASKRMGNVPLELSLPPGEHTLVLRHDDYEDTSTRVILEPRQRRAVDLSMEPIPSIFESWWFWTGAAVLLAGTTVTIIVVAQPEQATPGDIPPGVVSAPLGF